MVIPTLRKAFYKMFPKTLFTFSNIWFLMFRVTSILCLAAFAYGVFIFASNSFISPNPQFLADHMLAGFIGVLMSGDARRLSKRMAWLMG
jgi:hypothetical protein